MGGIIPDNGKRLQDFYEKHDYCPPYTLRAKYWRKYCPELAMTAVKKALKEWGGDKNKITHVVSHSTTGWDVPGLSHHVMYNLELPTSARAVPVNFVGCQGGTSVMFVASTIAKQDPNAVVLALCAEVCHASHIYTYTIYCDSAIIYKTSFISSHIVNTLILFV